MKYDRNDTDSIMSYAQLLEGSCLKDYGGEYLIKGGKGKLGQLIESEYFGYPINSRQEADFIEVGLELKVCPLKKINCKLDSKLIREQRGFSAKERIIITIINYMKLGNENWAEATVINKLNLLLMFYIHEKDKKPDELLFELINTWNPSENDILVIERDWLTIQKRVLNGEAHLLSEGDTMYLGACTKGANSSSVRKQPYSTEEAKQRAFSLKRSYVDVIVEELYQKRKLNRIEMVRSERWTSTKETFYDYLLNNLNGNNGRTLKEMIDCYSIKRERKAKHFISLIVNDIIKNVMGEGADKLLEFKKANIEMKTILISPDGIPKEHMSFEQINFIEIVNEEWEDSCIREKFELKKQLWVIFKSDFKYSKQTDLKLENIKFHSAFFWNMPIEDLENEYHALWEDTVHKIQNGKYDDFISPSKNRVGHIRPKAKNSKDLMITPQGTLEKKKSFWLNSTYIAEQIKKSEINSRSQL